MGENVSGGAKSWVDVSNVKGNLAEGRLGGVSTDEDGERCMGDESCDPG